MHLEEVISYCSNRIPQTWCTDFCRYLYCRLSLQLPPNSEIILEIQRWAKLPFLGCDLRECCRQVEAEVLSNSRKKIHPTCELKFYPTLSSNLIDWALARCCNMSEMTTVMRQCKARHQHEWRGNGGEAREMPLDDRAYSLACSGWQVYNHRARSRTGLRPPIRRYQGITKLAICNHSELEKNDKFAA